MKSLRLFSGGFMVAIGLLGIIMGLSNLPNWVEKGIPYYQATILLLKNLDLWIVLLSFTVFGLGLCSIIRYCFYKKGGKE